VVAGFKSPDHSAPLLAAAFVVAAERGDDLVIVHGWKLPTAYDDVIGAQLTAQSVRQHVVDTIRPLIADLRKANPQVEVSIRVRHSRAAKALVEASRGADAVVMMRPDLPGGPYPGSTTRAVLRDSACPTLVLPGPVGVRPATRFVLEKHGAFQP
jgi:nucleotide-binding universal stress UspA family protein